jgi:hypothetical protein
VAWEIDHLQFIQQLFPCGKFVINIRKDVAAQVRSGFHMKHETGEAEVVEGKTHALLTMAEQLGEERAFVLELESFSVEIFNKLLDWLGIEVCEFSKVLHANNSEKGGTYELDTKSEIDSLVGECICEPEKAFVLS